MMMKQTQTIRDFYGRVLGYVEDDGQGNCTAYDFYRRVLGRYSKSLDSTQDFYGRVLARGNITTALVYGQGQKS